MTVSESSAVVQPSSVLGFGAALTLLHDEREIARLLSESLAAVVPVELCAVGLYDEGPDAGTSRTPTGDDIVLIGQLASGELSDAPVKELCRMAARHRTTARTAPQAERGVEVRADAYPALHALRLRTCTLIRLGTVDHEFGVILLGATETASLTSEDVTAAQMLAAQASLALDRIQADKEREAKAEALRRSEQALREARDELESRVAQRTAELKRTNERLRKQSERLEILRDIDRAILAAESPEEIATEAIQRVQKILPYKSATVTVIDWEADEAHVLAAHNNVLDSPTTLPLDEVYLSDTLKKGETEVISDQAYEPVPEAKKRMRKMDLRSILCLPMVVEGDVIGVVHVGRTEPDAFTEEDWHVGRELANHMAIVLRQSQLLEEITKRREELEERVQERTEELESFTYSVSHDLRTPLRAIDGFSRMLLDNHADQLDDEGRRKLNVICENTQKMGQLIDDLLALSRLGRHDMRRRAVDMEALAQEVFGELVRNEPDRNVTFELQPIPDAHVDRAMMRRVFENLLSNALKFTQHVDDPRIKVGATESGDGTVYFVRDNGAGFDAEYAHKMFGVFQRLHDEEEFEGTGVGLAIVERVLRRHDGEVWVEGDVGEGATFYFCVSCSAAPKITGDAPA